MSTHAVISDDDILLDSLLNDDNIINNDIIITINKTKHECYACLETKDNMVKPCDTINCKARMCTECIKKQIETNDSKCGMCRNPIIIKKGVFNKNKCCEKFMKICYMCFLIVVGSILTFLMALGNTVRYPFIRCTTNVYSCDDMASVTIIATIPFILLFLQGHFISCRRNDKKYWKYNLSNHRFLLKDVFLLP